MFYKTNADHNKSGMLLSQKSSEIVRLGCDRPIEEPVISPYGGGGTMDVFLRNLKEVTQNRHGRSGEKPMPSSGSFQANYNNNNTQLLC